MARIESLQAQAALQLKNLEQGGALDKGMQEIASDVTGKWTGIGGAPEAAADSLIQSINRKAEAHARSQGGQGARQELHVDPTTGRLYTAARGQATFASPRAGMPTMRTADGRIIQGQSTSAAQQTPGYVVQDQPGAAAAAGGGRRGRR
jgi:hypothetical protein